MAIATHISEANNAKLKEDSTKLKKLYTFTLLILSIDQLINVIRGIIKPIIIGILQITMLQFLKIYLVYSI